MTESSRHARGTVGRDVAGVAVSGRKRGATASRATARMSCASAVIAHRRKAAQAPEDRPHPDAGCGEGLLIAWRNVRWSRRGAVDAFGAGNVW